MKNLLVLSLIFFVSLSNIDAQRRTQTIKWFSIAAKAGIGNSIFLNSDIMNDKNVEFSYLTLSQSYGGRFTFSFGDNLGFGLELLSSSYGQKYTITNSTSTNEKSIKLKTIDFLPFFRYTGNTGGYVELGAKFSTVSSVTEINMLSSVSPRADLQSLYEPKFISPIFGFGLALYKNERLDVNIGARFAYSFKDITPNTKYNVAYDNLYLPNYVEMTKTNPLSAQAILEVNYYFAFWGDAKCGRGRLMLFQ